MTKFDFKQWVINNKHGKLNEQDARQRPQKGREVDMEMPPEDIGDFMPSPDDASIDPIDPMGPAMQSTPCVQVPGNVCHSYKKCINNSPGGTTYVFAMGGTNNPGDWYSNNFGSPTLSTGVGGAFTITGGGSSGEKLIYQGVTTNVNLDVIPFSQEYPGVFPPPTGHAPACCGPAGCNDTSATGTNNGSTVSAGNTCGCSGTNPNDTSCCVYGQPEFTECQNCCCRSSLQMKISPQDQDGLTKGNNMEPRINPDGGVFDKEIRENINPTVDAIEKLIILAEQRRLPKSDRIARDVKRGMEKSPQDFDDGEMPIDPTLAPSALTPASPIGPGVIAGPCDAGHYISGAPGPYIATGGFAPDPVVGNIDPTTGMCECNNNDPNNPWGMITITGGYMNPNPGTPNTTGASNGTGAC